MDVKKLIVIDDGDGYDTMIVTDTMIVMDSMMVDSKITMEIVMMKIEAK